MDDYDYINEMQRIGFTLMLVVVIITIMGITLYQLGHETQSYVLMGILILVSILSSIYASIRNKRQFAKGEKMNSTTFQIIDFIVCCILGGLNGIVIALDIKLGLLFLLFNIIFHVFRWINYDKIYDVFVSEEEQ